MPEKKFGIDLKSYDDIFKTEEEREEDRLSKIRDIPISEIDDFPYILSRGEFRLE